MFRFCFQNLLVAMYKLFCWSGSILPPSREKEVNSTAIQNQARCWMQRDGRTYKKSRTKPSYEFNMRMKSKMYRSTLLVLVLFLRAKKISFVPRKNLSSDFSKKRRKNAAIIFCHVATNTPLWPLFYLYLWVYKCVMKQFQLLYWMIQKKYNFLRFYKTQKVEQEKEMVTIIWMYVCMNDRMISSFTVSLYQKNLKSCVTVSSLCS